MTDVLIRDVPDDVVSAIEAKARRLGLSRTEYLRRQMLRVASTSDEPVSVESLRPGWSGQGPSTSAPSVAASR